jgi:hypothetical protein
MIAQGGLSMAGFRFFHVPIWGVILLAGCIPAKPKTPAPEADEKQAVRETVVAFQSALKAGDAEKLWPLLDSDSQSDAERAAKAIQEAYAKASPEEKTKQEEALGLPGAELAALNGRGFLKTKRFHGKYHEVPGSTIDKVTVQGDTAKVDYTEEDGDKEKLSLVRQDGQWKLSLPMPK